MIFVASWVMVLVLLSPLTVTVRVVPSRWIVWVTLPESFWTLIVMPAPLVLLSSTEQMRVSDMAGPLLGVKRGPPAQSPSIPRGESVETHDQPRHGS
ncbi:MAG: hypothetical protein QM820_09000 [Minicystis sp.]